MHACDRGCGVGPGCQFRMAAVSVGGTGTSSNFALETGMQSSYKALSKSKSKQGAKGLGRPPFEEGGLVVRGKGGCLQAMVHRPPQQPTPRPPTQGRTTASSSPIPHLALRRTASPSPHSHPTSQWATAAHNISPVATMHPNCIPLTPMRANSISMANAIEPGWLPC